MLIDMLWEIFRMFNFRSLRRVRKLAKYKNFPIYGLLEPAVINAKELLRKRRLPPGMANVQLFQWAIWDKGLTHLKCIFLTLL